MPAGSVQAIHAPPAESDAAYTLSPFPEGWYFVAGHKALRQTGLIQKTWMGGEIVAWCDGDGRVCVADSICPHLGSRLGPAAGGLVRDGCLVCPFHGFEYDVTGQCVATPCAPPPRTAKLNVYPTREVLGLVFAWWGAGGRPPQWDLPEYPPDGADWSEPGFRSFRFAGHPQETTENAVDMAHLRYVHGYDNVDRVGTVSVDGAHMLSAFNFRRTRRIAGMATLQFDVSAIVHIHGLGYSHVEIHERSIDMHGRLWVLATPVDGAEIDLTLVSQVRSSRKPKRPIVGLGFLPARLRAKLFNALMLTAQRRDVLQDVIIWERKQYRSRPRLSRADGEIGLYRRYCRQFYPDRYGTAEVRTRSRRTDQERCRRP